MKITHAQLKNIIENLNLQIRVEEFSYQQKAKELEKIVSFYKSKVRQMEKNFKKWKIH
jgi:proteasome assembly chaperone (PAC2) family protein